MHSARQGEARIDKAVGGTADAIGSTRRFEPSARAVAPPRERTAPTGEWTVRPRHEPPRILDVRDIREGQRTPEVLRRDTRARRSLALADFAAACVALAVGVLVGGTALRPAAALLPLVIVLFCKLARLYDRDDHVISKATLDQAPALFQVGTVYGLVVWFAGDVVVDGGFGRLGMAAMLATLLVTALVFRVVARRATARSLAPERVLVLGGPEACERLRDRIATAHSLRAEIVGRVALERGDRNDPAPLGPIDDLDFVIRSNDVERVIIAPSESTSDEMLDTIRIVKALGVKVSVLPRLFEVVGSSLEFDDIDGITILGLRRYGLTKTSWYVKRTTDVILTSFGLVVLAPVLLIIAIAIKLTSSGPILFRQPRVGRGGRSFAMLKFRTMYEGADEDKARLAPLSAGRDGLFKVVNDPRVTPIGRLLRRSSLDELPQLFNVLRGEMSLVGPRPLIEEEDEKIAGWHYRRREGTPGCTGVWQVLGPTRVSLDDMVKLDYLYRANWSLWLDLKILLRTAGHMFSGRGI
jgi:exopolysaccharide biosynthesis polyprenyl glycosylphosphotransferase